MNKAKPLVIVLIGPTASGKTELAIEIAERIESAIHNIDSRQLYKGMDIGTAKPTQNQQKRVKHYLINLREPNKPMTMSEFKQTAQLSLEKNFKKKNIGLLAGGSGLYLKAITRGLCPPEVPSQQNLREQLTSIGLIECHKLLEKCDPISAKKISPKDSSRTIRALEVFYATGKPISSQINLKPPNWNLIEIGLNPKDLNERIAKRTKSIYKNGLVEETKILSKKYGDHLPLLQTIGYAEALNSIKGEMSVLEAIEITTRRTIQFAKRQKTWFKGQHNATWLNETNPLEEAMTLIQNVIGLRK